MENEEINYVKKQLNNSLRGSAMLLKNNITISGEEKLKKMKAIEQMKNYIDNYEENMKLIDYAKKYHYLMEDDCR